MQCIILGTINAVGEAGLGMALPGEGLEEQQ